LLLTVLGASAGHAAAEEPAHGRAPHPEPRVIVNVLSVKGPHERASVERSARLAWGRIVRCYKSIEQRERGSIGLELIVAGSGKVVEARRTQSTLESQQLAQCLTDAMKRLSMPKAEGRSTARAEIHVAPGDPP
jgi:hypothetical protein